MLRYRDQSVEVNELHSSVVMGRADENDLVVKNTLISRMHARNRVAQG